MNRSFENSLNVDFQDFFLSVFGQDFNSPLEDIQSIMHSHSFAEKPEYLKFAFPLVLSFRVREQ